MKNLMSEKEVLHKLGISDFRHLKKNQVIQLASMLEDMEPEVAKKALEQFPEFGKTISGLAEDYKDILEKGLNSNDESMRANANSLQSIIDLLIRLAEKENLSFEERKYYIEKALEAQNLLAKKDTENKNFIERVLGYCGWIIVGAGLITFAAIGGKAKFKNPFGQKNEQQENLN